MPSWYKPLLVAGPVAIAGLALIVLAGMWLPVALALMVAVIFMAGGKPNTPFPTADLALLASVPLQMSFLGSVLIATAKKRLLPGVRVSNPMILLYAIVTATLSMTAIILNPRTIPLLSPIGVAVPLLLVVMRFVEKPSPPLQPVDHSGTP